MPRFFSDEINDDIAFIRGSDAVHIGRSLRMKTGDELIICSKGIEYITIIQSISDEQVVCEIKYSQPSKSEPNIDLTLFQAVPKGDKLDFIIQKAVELGASRIYPVITSRCVSRPDKKSFDKKHKRLQKIALEAAKQSGRGIVPQVEDIIDFKKCTELLGQMDFSFVCYENGGKKLNESGLRPNSNVGIFIGSEGGFEQSEVDECIKNGITVIGLGNRILRCETAPVTAISIVMNLTGNI